MNLGAPFYLIGFSFLLVPILLHLVRQRGGGVVDWGAMALLEECVTAVRLKFAWTEVLLMVLRLSLITLLVLVFVDPGVTAGAGWDAKLALAGLLGVGLSGVVLVAVGIVRERSILLWSGVSVLTVGVGLLLFLGGKEEESSLGAGEKVLVLLPDQSRSLRISVRGRSLFETLKQEGRSILEEAAAGQIFLVPDVREARGWKLGNRTASLEAWERLEVTDVPFRAMDALTGASVLLLKAGVREAEFYLLSDDRLQPERQKVGVDGLDLGQLKKAWDDSGLVARLGWKILRSAEQFSNLAVSSVQVSPAVPVVGAPVLVRAVLENQGTVESVPGELVLRVDGVNRMVKSVSGLLPGGQTEVVFSLSEPAAGWRVLEVSTPEADDLAADNRMEAVLKVREKLQILVVEGRTEAPFFKRAGSFLSLALAPWGGGGGAFTELQSKSLLEFTEMDLEGLAKVDVIILADVARLSVEAEKLLRSFASGGGGVLVLPGRQVDLDYWRAMAEGDESLLPARLRGLVMANESQLKTGLEGLERPEKSLPVVLSARRRLGRIQDGGKVLLETLTGKALVVGHPFGRGKVALAALPFDGSQSEFPQSRFFPGFMNELVQWLVESDDWRLTVSQDGQEEWAVPLPEGLVGRYYEGTGEERKLAGARRDRQVNFKWLEEGPLGTMDGDWFEVEWAGWVQLPEEGSCVLRVEADDSGTLEIGGLPGVKAEFGRAGEISVPPETRGWRPLLVTMKEGKGQAVIRLLWKARGSEWWEKVPPAAFTLADPESPDFPKKGGRGPGVLWTSRDERSFPLVLQQSVEEGRTPALGDEKLKELMAEFGAKWLKEGEEGTFLGPGGVRKHLFSPSLAVVLLGCLLGESILRRKEVLR